VLLDDRQEIVRAFDALARIPRDALQGARRARPDRQRSLLLVLPPDGDRRCETTQPRVPFAFICRASRPR
jgi:hypothetical protein